ncbi:CoA-binding protein [Natrialbaceae archaeon A-gly3]
MPVESDACLREILGLETIAVVGCSRSPGKPAHDVPKYMADRDYEVIPVNPHAEDILSRRAYDSLIDIDAEIDVVCVFRPSDELEAVVDDVLEREDVRVVWTQLGITGDEALERVRASGRTVVEDRCMKVEHRKHLG